MILVTGAAGFIGYHLAARLLSEGRRVMGVDNLNSYYDPRLKRARLTRLMAHPGFEFLAGGSGRPHGRRSGVRAAMRKENRAKWWSIWRRKRGCGTRSRTRTRIRNLM